MNNLKSLVLLFFLLIVVACDKDSKSIEPMETPISWKFAVVGDTHVTNNSDTIKEMIPYLLEDGIDLILVCGDIVEGTKAISPAELENEFEMWLAIFKPLYDKGIGVYPVRGNHENGAPKNIEVWNKIFTGDKALPQNGPSGETNLTYSFQHKNAMFIGLDEYVNIHKVNQSWLNQELATNEQAHVFVFGHEAAFKVFHSDCLDNFSTERNTFWNSLTEAGVKTYFCGHDHFFDATQIDDGDGNTENDIYQCLIGGGGGWLMPKYNYNGENSPYTVNAEYHSEEHGYALVEISGETESDLNVRITWKERTIEGASVKYISTLKEIAYKVTQTH